MMDRYTNYLLWMVLFLSLANTNSYGQNMTFTTYHDPSIPRAEPDPGYYDFVFPVHKEFYDSLDFTPPFDGRFFVQNYGPRYIGDYDNHQGSDIWGHTVLNGVVTLNPPAVAMCDGEIITLIDGSDMDMEATTSGRTIRIRCDSSSQIFNSPINIYYRHLDSIDINLVVGDLVAKGDVVGTVGASGSTTLSHLHFDYRGVPNMWGNNTSLKYLNPMRLFDPEEHPHVLGKLDNAHFEIMHDWQDSTLIRIHWPHNQHVNRFEFTNDTFNLIYDVEEVRASYPVYEPSIWARDSMKIYPYRTNGYRSAQYYQQNYNYPAILPNSPDRDTSMALYGFPHIPLIADSVVNVYDFMIEHVHPTHKTKDWKVKLSDVWGNVVDAITDCSNLVENTSNWGAGSLRAAINCAEENDTIFFSSIMNDSIFEVDLPVINISKELYFEVNANQNITLSNKVEANTEVLFSITDELHLTGLKIIGKNEDSMILKVEAGGSINLYSGTLDELDIRN